MTTSSRVAWVVYGGLEARTGGTIYDAIIARGLGGVNVVAIAPGEPIAPLAARVSDADVVVGDELCFRELAALFPRLAARRVLLVHHLSSWEVERSAEERAELRVLELAAVRAADTIVTTSETTRARLRAELSALRPAAAATAPPIAVVLPGSDRLPRLARAPSAHVSLLFVGAVAPRKRAREVVEALRDLPRCELRVVGSRARDPDYAASVTAAAPPNVTFLDEIDEGSLARELAAAHALVMPSSLEGYGIAATEAIAAGLPVIAARAPGLVEALATCADAVVFVDDASALGATLRRVATDRALRERLAAAAAGAAMPRWADAVAGFRALLA